MKIVISLFGVLVTVMGAWPLIKDLAFIPESVKFIPSTGIGYNIVLIVIGLMAAYYGMSSGRYGSY